MGLPYSVGRGAIPQSWEVVLMRRMLWALALVVVFATPVPADVNNLAGGAMIAHYVDELAYSGDEPAEGWCGAYTPYAITDHTEQVNRMDVATYGPKVWYVIAAWSEDKNWCGGQFGTNDYDAAVFTPVEAFPCFPDVGLEIPEADWPGPSSGTAFVTTETSWTGNYVPIYFFGGYAYGYGTPDVVELVPYTPSGSQVDPFAGFSNCQSPPIDYDALALGGMGVNTDGIYAQPEVIEVGACCVGTTCLPGLTQQQCDDQGGDVWYVDTSCSPNPCDPTGVCCYGSTTISCAVNTESQCATLQGTWHPEWTSCDPNPCKPAACCTDGECQILTELECQQAGGDFWLQTVTSCDPNPCLTYACCIPGEACQNLTEDECLAITGATWHEGFKCNQAHCDNLGACCFDEEPYCRMMWEAECAANHPEITGGFEPGEIWHPTRDCESDDPCFPSPVQESTWGQIKRLYQ